MDVSGSFLHLESQYSLSVDRYQMRSHPGQGSVFVNMSLWCPLQNVDSVFGVSDARDCGVVLRPHDQGTAIRIGERHKSLADVSRHETHLTATAPFRSLKRTLEFPEMALTKREVILQTVLD